jgi:hypothetical protein
MNFILCDFYLSFDFFVFFTRIIVVVNNETSLFIKLTFLVPQHWRHTCHSIVSHFIPLVEVNQTIIINLVSIILSF